MTSIYIRHEVADYDAWKPHFDDHASVREEHGAQGYHLFRGVENPDEVSIVFEWDGIESARQFFASSDVREAMREAGVVGDPEISYLDEVESSTPRRTAA
jgi:heme-degrading monooxygenase HmoA